MDATFRLACAGLVPDHVTISRFRQRACGDGGPMEEVFYAVLRVCAAAGLGRLSVVAVDGVKIGANASKEANRTEAGLRKLAAAIMAEAAGADEPGAAEAGEDLFGGEVLPPGWARSAVAAGAGCGRAWRTSPHSGRPPRRRGGRRGRRGWMRWPLGEPVTKPPACVAVEAARIALEQEVARHQALAGDWDRKRAAGEKTGRKPVPVEASRRVARQRERLERAEAVAAAQPQQEEQAGDGEPGGKRKRRRNLSRCAMSPTRPRR